MKIRITLIMICILVLFSSCDTTIKEEKLQLGNAEKETLFTINGISGIFFNTSDIIVDGDKVTEGALKNTAISGFTGTDDEITGYFLPLKILTNEINADASIQAVFMNQEVKADIIKSGNSYYAIILLTSDITLKFNTAELSIEIRSGNKLLRTNLTILQRTSTGNEPGIVLKPVIEYAW